MRWVEPRSMTQAGRGGMETMVRRRGGGSKPWRRPSLPKPLDAAHVCLKLFSNRWMRFERSDQNLSIANLAMLHYWKLISFDNTLSQCQGVSSSELLVQLSLNWSDNCSHMCKLTHLPNLHHLEEWRNSSLMLLSFFIRVLEQASSFKVHNFMR